MALRVCGSRYLAGGEVARTIMANIEKLKEQYGNVIWTGKKCICGLPISFTRYILTDSKLITRRGLLNLKEDEVELYRIYDKSMDLPFWQRIVGCGTVTLLSKDRDTPTKKLESIKNPREVKKTIDEAVQEQRDKYNVRGRDMIGSALGQQEDMIVGQVDIDI